MKNGMIFNILIKREGETYIAHCLELDIVATADSLDTLHSDIIDLIVAQVDYAFSNDNLENLYHPAPAEVWAEFYSCKEKKENRIKLDSLFSDNDHGLKSFVPPWIIANTCHSQETKVV